MQKTILAIALALGAFPAAAFAQTTVGGVHVSEAGLPYVADYCEELASKSPMDAYEHKPSRAQAAASGIDLNSLQLSDCQRAGLV